MHLVGTGQHYTEHRLGESGGTGRCVGQHGDTPTIRKVRSSKELSSDKGDADKHSMGSNDGDTAKCIRWGLDGIENGAPIRDAWRQGSTAWG